MKKIVLFIAMVALLLCISCRDMSREGADAIQANPTLTTFGATSLSKDQQVWFWADAES